MDKKKVTKSRLSKMSLSEKVSACFLFSVMCTALAGGICYYTIENQTGIEKEADDPNIFSDASGDLYSYFDVGEHIVKISRNDMYYHEYNKIDNYEIIKIDVKGWRDNSTIYYANTVPVVVKVDRRFNNKAFFDNFGEAQISNDNIKSK